MNTDVGGGAWGEMEEAELDGQVMNYIYTFFVERWTTMLLQRHPAPRHLGPCIAGCPWQRCKNDKTQRNVKEGVKLLVYFGKNI